MEQTSNNLRNELGNMKDGVKDNVKKGANTIKKNIEEGMESSGWQDRYEEIQERSKEMMEASEDFVKSHPYYTLLGVATVGFVAGMLLRRR